MSTADQPRPIAVIGAGFSGTMAAIQLLRALPPERSVLLCERADVFGRGIAYNTGNPDHLLNLRAANMSAFPDRPGDFTDWLGRADLDAREREGIRTTAAGTFAARGLYGRYLTELLMQAVVGSGPGSRLHLLQDAVVDLVPEASGFSLRTEGGTPHRVAGAVLAMGNMSGTGPARSQHRIDPWKPESFGRLDPHRPILIVGTGLTMVDAVAALRRHGFAGKIVAVSRRGLLPNAHAATDPWPLPDLPPEAVSSLTVLLGIVRREIVAARAAGTDWRGVLDALRPITDAIWRGLPPDEQARFLRHLRPFWDVHRHRTAPPAADAITDEIAQGILDIRAGRILSVVDAPAHTVVTIRPRGSSETVAIEAQCILDATGFGRVTDLEDPLIRNLVARDLVQSGPFGFGLDAGPDYRVVGRAGTGTLWAIGPLLRGVLWECIAVPDIRTEAAELARTVAGSLPD